MSPERSWCSRSGCSRPTSWWDGETIQVIGNLRIAFADYDMEAPTAAAVVSVDDEGEMEFQIFFEPE